MEKMNSCMNLSFIIRSNIDWCLSAQIKYTVNQRLLVSVNTEFLCDVFFHVCKHPSPCDVTTSWRHIALIAILWRLFSWPKKVWPNCHLLQNWPVDHIGVLETPMNMNRQIYVMLISLGPNDCVKRVCYESGVCHLSVSLSVKLWKYYCFPVLNR